MRNLSLVRRSGARGQNNRSSQPRLAISVDDRRYFAPLATSVATGSFVWLKSCVVGPFLT